MIDVKTAVRAAMTYLQDFKEFVPAQGVRLEETEYDDKGNWLITLSTIDEPEGQLAGAFGALVAAKRSYRRFCIDAKTGDVKSMKVRTLQPIE